MIGGRNPKRSAATAPLANSFDISIDNGLEKRRPIRIYGSAFDEEAHNGAKARPLPTASNSGGYRSASHKPADLSNLRKSSEARPSLAFAKPVHHSQSKNARKARKNQFPRGCRDLYNFRCSACTSARVLKAGPNGSARPVWLEAGAAGTGCDVGYLIVNVVEPILGEYLFGLILQVPLCPRG